MKLPLTGRPPVTVGIGEAFAGDQAIVAGAARIPVVPEADIDRELVEGGADAAVEVDLGRGAIREADAGAAEAGVELPVLVRVVARLEVGRDRGMVIRLRDAAEDVVAGDRGTERHVPSRRRRRCDRFGLGDQIGSRTPVRQTAQARRPPQKPTSS